MEQRELFPRPARGMSYGMPCGYTLWNSVSCSPRPVRGMRYRIFWNMKGNEMKITLLTVGKVKEKFYVQAIGEFTKRLSRYCKLEILEVADEKTPVGGSGQGRHLSGHRGEHWGGHQGERAGGHHQAECIWR